MPPKAKAAPAPARVRGKADGYAIWPGPIPRNLKPLYQVCSVMAKGLPLVRQLRFNDDHRIYENFDVALAGLEAHLRTLLGQDRLKRQLNKRQQAMRARAKARRQAACAQATAQAAGGEAPAEAAPAALTNGEKSDEEDTQDT